MRFEVATVPEGPVLEVSAFRVYFWEFDREGRWLNCADEYEVTGLPLDVVAAWAVRRAREVPATFSLYAVHPSQAHTLVDLDGIEGPALDEPQWTEPARVRATEIPDDFPAEGANPTTTKSEGYSRRFLVGTAEGRTLLVEDIGVTDLLTDETAARLGTRRITSLWSLKSPEPDDGRSVEFGIVLTQADVARLRPGAPVEPDPPLLILSEH